ncbi:MAG: MBL fold metallo-hydrolase [Rhodocyclaceae bacterium]|nr:MBL fold metallo-hydrolase [Rhodocyclaceae bacterium]
MDEVETYVDGLDFAVRGTYGGHSSCVEIEHRNEVFILDMGSGARALGQALLARYGAKQRRTYHVFISHLHWDHIMGLPFFAPAYITSNRIIIHGCHGALEMAFHRQQDAPSFPVDFGSLGAHIEFDVIEPGRRFAIADFSISAMLQRHGGDSYGWRFEQGGKTVVYSTDSEHRVEDVGERAAFTEFFRNADLVIFDAMYSLADAISVKADWGHSSNITGVELCQLANAKKLCLYHHEPAYDDRQIAGVLEETRRFEALTRNGATLEVLSAYDGLELEP